MIWFDFRVLVAIKCNLYIKWNVDNGQIHLTNGKNFKISIFTADQSMENEKKNTKLTLNEPYRLCFWYSNRISLSSDLFNLFVANRNLWVTASAINVNFLFSLCVYSLKMRHWSKLLILSGNKLYQPNDDK